MTKKQFNGTTVVHQQDSILNKNDTFIPNYVPLSEYWKKYKSWRIF